MITKGSMRGDICPKQGQQVLGFGWNCAVMVGVRSLFSRCGLGTRRGGKEATRYDRLR